MSHRTQITLTDEQYDRLRAESASTGLGLAALVRRALERSYGGSSDLQLRQALDASFGSWAEGVSGSDYVDGLRRGMGRRLSDA